MSNDTNGTPRQRVQIDFSADAFARLDEVRMLAEAKTNAEVIRNAIRVFEWFLKQQKAGFRIHLVKDGQAKDVELLF